MRVLINIVLITMILGCTTTQPETSLLEVSNKSIENHIQVYVTPYYESSSNLSMNPKVKVSKQYDRLLSSTKSKDILTVEKSILDKPELITPMTMMVLAIRMYDVGERDKAIFWFYVAKDRYITLSDVLNINDPSLFQVKQSVIAFASLAGPYINSYAFCNIKKQQTIRNDAFNWVTLNPYQALFMEQLPAKEGNRKENLERSLNDIDESIKKFNEFLSNPQNVDELNLKRKQKDVDSQFCY